MAQQRQKEKKKRKKPHIPFHQQAKGDKIRIRCDAMPRQGTGTGNRMRHGRIRRKVLGTVGMGPGQRYRFRYGWLCLSGSGG